MARGRSRPSHRSSEFVGLIAFALAALVAISLFSFDPLDRSYFTSPPPGRGDTRNLAGAVGANLGHALLVAFGLLAFAVPVVLIIFGVRRLRGLAGRPRWSIVGGAVLLWVSLAALLTVTVDQVRFRGSDRVTVRTVPVPAGGLAGQAVAAGLAAILGPAGSLVVLLTGLTAGLVLTTPFSVGRTVDRSLERGVGALSGARRLAGGWLARRRRGRVKSRETRGELKAKEREETGRRLATAIDEAAAAKEREIAAAARVATEARRSEASKRDKAAAAAAAPVARDVQPASPPIAPGPLSDLLDEMPQARKAAPASARAASAEASVSNAAKAALARVQAGRAAAVTLKLDVARGQSDQPAPPPAPALAPAPAPAAPPAAPALPAPRGRAADRRPGHEATPAAVAAMAAEATDAVRRARLEKDGTKPESPADRQTPEVRRRQSAKTLAEEDFALPPLSLLETINNDAVVTERELVENAKVLVSKLREFAVDGTVQAIHPGPVVTTYEYRPEAGVKYSKIVGLADDLCLAMKAEGVRIDRISGKSAVGIEVPNSARETISLKEMLLADPFQKSASKLTLALGKGISGEPYVTDLRKMPHLLIAGATGSGKSVQVNCMIVSVLYKATPEEVKFIMVDPKRIELGVYDGIPHLLVPVVTDPRLASNALRWAVCEMENRYKRLASFGVRSLEQFNSIMRGPEAKKLAENATPEELQPLPYIIILIDELADLMMVSAADVEDSISRLAAMARAVGIHLVLATQRPSVDVITGVIKANFPSRISFRVSSKVDSRTILDSNGAEMLLGKGDMLFMPPGSARLLRVHGAFISDGEVQRLVNYLKNQRDPEYNQEVLATPAASTEDVEGEMDEMYDEAVRVVLETGQASVSHLQRRLRLGYSRAARLVDIMELNGIVGPSQGAKGREILIDRNAYLMR